MGSGTGRERGDQRELQRAKQRRGSGPGGSRMRNQTPELTLRSYVNVLLALSCCHCC